MRLASALGIAFAILAWAYEPQGPPLGVDLSRERQLVLEARASVKAVDLAAARSKAGEAIELLLARAESERGAAWLELLDAAARAAGNAQDARAARSAWEKVVEVRSRTLPDDHEDLQHARLDLAITLDALGDLAAARALEEKVLEVRLRTLPDDHADVQKARASLAITLRSLGDLAAARALQGKVLEVLSRTLPDDHLDLQRARANLANTLLTLGDLAAARALEEKVVEVFSRTLPGDHPDLQKARASLASTLANQGEFAEARALGEKVLEVFTRTLPGDHADLQRARVSLAYALASLGDLESARALEEKVLEVLSRTLPDDHPDLQKARLVLAHALRELGDLATARALEEKVLEVDSRTLPDDHPDLQMIRGSLAETLRSLGDLAAARALEEKVLEVSSRTLPDDHPSLQAARAGLAATLYAQGDIQSARLLFEEVLEVFLRTLPDDHPGVQAAREGLASSLVAQGELPAARELFETVLEVRTRTLPDNHPHLQAARGNLAKILFALGEIAPARALEEKVLDVLSRTLPDEHPSLQEARSSLVFTLAAQRVEEKGAEGHGRGREGVAEEFARQAGSFTRALVRSARAAALTASAREAEERCASSLPNLGRALSIAAGLGVFESDPGLERESFVLSEETRGAALVSAHLSRRACADPRYGTLRETMRTASDELARLAQRGAGADAIDAARNRRETAERELLELARELTGNEAGLLELDPAALSGALSAREALVGYRRYRRSTHGEPKPTESLCAFVLRAGDRLERIELGPVEPIERAVERWREAIGVRLQRGLAADVNVADESRLRGEELRKLVFDPLRSALDETERVVVALDDVLNLVPLDALPFDDVPREAAPLEQAGGMPGLATGERIGDRWRIETRCTLSELAWKDADVPRRETLLAIGGASFNLAPLAPSAEESAGLEVERTGTKSAAPLARGDAWERGFEPLTHSGPEARGIATVYAEAFEDERPALVLEKRKASRASLVELAPRARFLHIATHGWFAPASVRSIADPDPLDAKLSFGARMSGEERARGMSPMLLCGLALAGANLREDELGRAPGLLTAEEISTLDLAGCELAVLSACDTNVGERRAGQGVASLQKALHMAGARTVITSLWKVPDEATRVLMLDFYRRIWIEKKPKGVALWEAKRKIRDAQDERGRPLYSTRDWAAWVLTGDPR